MQKRTTTKRSCQNNRGKQNRIVPLLQTFLCRRLLPNESHPNKLCQTNHTNNSLSNKTTPHKQTSTNQLCTKRTIQIKLKKTTLKKINPARETRYKKSRTRIIRGKTLKNSSARILSCQPNGQAVWQGEFGKGGVREKALGKGDLAKRGMGRTQIQIKKTIYIGIAAQKLHFLPS